MVSRKAEWNPALSLAILVVGACRLSWAMGISIFFIWVPAQWNISDSINELTRN
jgi:hypothetical protein